ncbi:hypothetical protein [Planctomicrobium sp. SH664]|uniref:hypothetical protein n=1 Tax=Planctomicrobium sp. SH664 TaxID=3448125 RepID=UPI003F5C62FE
MPSLESPQRRTADLSLPCPSLKAILVKYECQCGHLVVDSEGSQRYRWLTTADWDRLLELIDDTIENLRRPGEKEAAIMKIRTAAKSNRVWECSACGRLLTDVDDTPLFLVKEAPRR